MFTIKGEVRKKQTRNFIKKDGSAGVTYELSILPENAENSKRVEVTEATYNDVQQGEEIEILINDTLITAGKFPFVKYFEVQS